MNSKAVLNWLMEKDQPSARYLALTMLLGEPESNPDVRKARALIPKVGVGISDARQAESAGRVV